MIIANGLKFSLFQTSFGSIIFQTKISIQINVQTSTTNWSIDGNWINDKTKGKLYEIIDPIFGIKFRKNINIAQNKAKSSPQIIITIKATKEEIKLTNAFITK